MYSTNRKSVMRGLSHDKILSTHKFPNNTTHKCSTHKFPTTQHTTAQHTNAQHTTYKFSTHKRPTHKRPTHNTQPTTQTQMPKRPDVRLLDFVVEIANQITVLSLLKILIGFRHSGFSADFLNLHPRGTLLPNNAGRRLGRCSFSKTLANQTRTKQRLRTQQNRQKQFSIP